MAFAPWKLMVTFISHSPAETEALGEGWGRECGRGWIIGLSGGLGAGKTQLVKGLARGLKADARVTSPTYALVHEYQGGRLPLFHVDLYRLDTREQIITAGLEPYLVRPDGVTVVEWVERWRDGTDAPWLGPGTFRRAQLKILGETDREICHEDFSG
jgi:tRNA threonylcarbamoyladenosine biosynthesis protein TsaE